VTASDSESSADQQHNLGVVVVEDPQEANPAEEDKQAKRSLEELGGYGGNYLHGGYGSSYGGGYGGGYGGYSSGYGSAGYGHAGLYTEAVIAPAPAVAVCHSYAPAYSTGYAGGYGGSYGGGYSGGYGEVYAGAYPASYASA
jgi:hypothetical protein